MTISTPVKRPHVVAVVDDDPSLRKALGRLLTTLGYRVELFASSDALMNASGSLEATCLIIDINLGDGSGLDLARRLAKIDLAVPIIFMTGGHDDIIRRQCLDLGCVAFLLKPFTEERLVEAIAEATRGATPPPWTRSTSAP
jgi:FixJ family two-component response regulator